jgi:hypothetical protein
LVAIGRQSRPVAADAQSDPNLKTVFDAQLAGDGAVVKTPGAATLSFSLSTASVQPQYSLSAIGADRRIAGKRLWAIIVPAESSCESAH